MTFAIVSYTSAGKTRGGSHRKTYVYRDGQWIVKPQAPHIDYLPPIGAVGMFKQQWTGQMWEEMLGA